MNTHSIFLGSFSFSDCISPDCSIALRHDFHVAGSERISAMVWAPAAGFNSTNCSSAKLRNENLNYDHFDMRRAQPAKMPRGYLVVRDGVMDGRSRRDERKAASPEFAGIADDNRSLGVFHHHPVGARFQQVRSREPVFDIEPVHG